MTYVPGTNVLQLEIRGTYLGEEIENVLYFTNSAGINTTAVDALYDYLETNLTPPVLLNLSNSLTIDEYYGTDLTTQSSPTYSRSFSPPYSGQVTGSQAMPGNVAATISFRTQGRGRSARGRNYVVGLPENTVTGNAVSLTLINATVLAYESMLALPTLVAPWQWVVFSRYSNNLPRTVGLAQPVTDVLATSLIVGSQRGRLR